MDKQAKIGPLNLEPNKESSKVLREGKQSENSCTIITLTSGQPNSQQ